MVELDSRVDRRAGVSLVSVVVRNPTDVARRVRVRNRLDGPVWPPRREGVPAVGWDDGGFEGRLAPGERRGLGYASPAAPVDPPAELVWTERAASAESAGSGETPNVEETPESVVRALGDPRPPADAVPDPRPSRDPGSAIPDAVESWLSSVAERTTGDGSEPSREDAAALREVARRIARLRGVADATDCERSSVERGRSR